jgi:uncharacterized protein YdhG (YjbR/CyaY superfamily)
MTASRRTPANIDDYIAASPPESRSRLEQIRQTIHRAAPDAQETISYGMPAFFQDGIVVYFAAFKSHIGLYPPVRGDTDLEAALAPYAGLKRSLRFPHSQPVPYRLIERIAKLRVTQNFVKANQKESPRRRTR